MSITLKDPVHRFDHFIGTLNAPVLLVEYGDLECINSARALNVTDKLLAEFRDKVCFIFRHFPLQKHPNSAMASLALEAADRQGKFWKMYRLILRHTEELSPEKILGLAQEAGLDLQEFADAMDDTELMEKIERDLATGEASGVSQTPTFFINGIRMEYPTNYNFLRDEIISLLGESSSMTFS